MGLALYLPDEARKTRAAKKVARTPETPRMVAVTPKMIARVSLRVTISGVSAVNIFMAEHAQANKEYYRPISV